jgi:hypothetical protein
LSQGDKTKIVIALVTVEQGTATARCLIKVKNVLPNSVRGPEFSVYNIIFQFSQHVFPENKTKGFKSGELDEQLYLGKTVSQIIFEPLLIDFCCV